MSLSQPVALGVTGVSRPVRLGPYLDAGNSGTVGARRLRDLGEVWEADKPGIYVLSVDVDGAVVLTPTTPLPAGIAYHHVQIAAATTWVVSHELGFNPAGILAHDSAGDWVEADDVTYPDLNTLHIIFRAAISGVAELS